MTKVQNFTTKQQNNIRSHSEATRSVQIRTIKSEMNGFDDEWGGPENWREVTKSISQGMNANKTVYKCQFSSLYGHVYKNV